MSRRAFAWPIFIALLTFAYTAEAAPERIDRAIDGGWKFLRQDRPGAETSDFDDSSWQSIDLPHTWNVADGARHGDYYRGPGWYRRHVQIGRDLSGKRLFLRFGAASLVSDVFVNGQRAGHHEGGFGAFCFPISSFVHGGDNVIAVRVDNSYNPNVTPLSGDFTIYGGLYREVHLLALNGTHIDPTDDGSPGVFWTPQIKGDQADVEVRAEVRGSPGGTVQPVAVEFRVEDAQGKLVGQVTQQAQPTAESDLQVTAHLTIPRPHPWNGVDDPYLYRGEVRVIRNGKVLDIVQQAIGFRSYKVDPDRGLLLNGSYYDMHGVNIHQGRPSVGWADTHAMMDQDYAMVRELGCTGVRLPHYEHDDHEYSLCDRLGLVVWAELALVNRVTNSPEFAENAKQQLRELIKQNYNHPSIFFWSMYNEPGIDRRRGDQEWRLVDSLVALAHELDPTRPTTGAVSMSAKSWLDWVMDVTSFNRYWGWYDGAPSLWKTRLDSLRAEAGGRSFGISEYGAGASVNQHESDPKQPKTGGQWHPEEWQSLVHEAAWPELEARPWIWCKLLWVMFDFPSSGRHEGDQGGINDKGLVTGDRKTRKDAFFYYQACWTKKPMVYITERRYSTRPPGTYSVKVYSNCPSVELWVDGKSMGTLSSASHVFVWLNLALGVGGHEVRATAESGVRRVSDSITIQAANP